MSQFPRKIIPVCNTQDFLYLCKEAEKAGYNRQLDVRRITSVIDLEGTHVCSFHMIHEHIAGRLVPPHVRSMWYLKCEDQEKPMTVFLDISLDNFNRLHEYDVEKQELVK